MTRPQLTLSSPMVLYLQATNTCRMNCKQCYTECSADPPADELTFAEWQRFLDYLSANGVIHLHFEGGDPLLRPDFLDILRYAQKDFLLWFRTHATTVDDALAGEIAAIGVGRVIVDFFGTDPDMHDHLTGVPGSYRATLAGAERLRDHGVPVIPVGLVNRLNVSSLQKYVDLGLHLRAEEIGLLRLYPLGRSRQNWAELAPALPDIMAALAALEAPDGLRIMNGYHPYDANCCWVNAGVTSTGDSIGCPYLRGLVNYGNIRDMPFLQTWQDPLYRQLRTQEIDGDCPECTANKSLSPGGCRSTAFAFTGRWDAPDPFCTHMGAGTDVTRLPLTVVQR